MFYQIESGFLKGSWGPTALHIFNTPDSDYLLIRSVSDKSVGEYVKPLVSRTRIENHCSSQSALLACQDIVFL